MYVSIGAPGIAAKVYYKVKGERENNFSHVVNCEKIIYIYIYTERRRNCLSRGEAEKAPLYIVCARARPQR